jgi:hypothetical protein
VPGDVLSGPGETASVYKIPPCEFRELDEETPCDNEDELAEYDFKTQQGPWANGCGAHYRKYRLYTKLGVGMGQRLVKVDIP